MLKLKVFGKTQSFTIQSGKTAHPRAKAFTGNDLVLHFTVVDAAGDPVDISAWTTRSFALFSMAGVSQFTKTPAFVTDGTDGEFTVTIAVGDTSGLDAGNYPIEIQVSGTGIKSTVVRGLVTFQKTYTA